MRLANYDWPGNIREFRSFINKIVIFSENNFIDAEYIDSLFGTSEEDSVEKFSFRRAMQDSERTIIRNALITHDWNVTETALALGLDRTNLHKKMLSWGFSEMMNSR